MKKALMAGEWWRMVVVDDAPVVVKLLHSSVRV